MANRKSTRKNVRRKNVRSKSVRRKNVRRKSVRRKNARRKSQKRGYVKRKTHAKRHTKRNKRRNYKKRRRMKGGSCAVRNINSPTNIGKMFTGVDPMRNVLAYPESANTHNVPHISPGKAAMHIGGGSLLRSIGLGDVLQAQYGVEDNLQSSYNVLKGESPVTSSNVMKGQYNKL